MSAGMLDIRVSTTPTIPGYVITRHLGMVCAQACVAPEGLLDLEVFIRKVEAGRHPAFERAMAQARNEAFASFATQAKEMGANAVVGVDLDYAFLTDVRLLMVSLTGTAVVVKELNN